MQSYCLFLVTFRVFSRRVKTYFQPCYFILTTTSFVLTSVSFCFYRCLFITLQQFIYIEKIVERKFYLFKQNRYFNIFKLCSSYFFSIWLGSITTKAYGCVACSFRSSEKMQHTGVLIKMNEERETVLYLYFISFICL